MQETRGHTSALPLAPSVLVLHLNAGDRLSFHGPLLHPAADHLHPFDRANHSGPLKPKHVILTLTTSLCEVCLQTAFSGQSALGISYID